MNTEKSNTELIKMIYRSHVGEFIAPKRIREIVCAITGLGYESVSNRSIQKSITALVKDKTLSMAQSGNAYILNTNA